SLEAMALEDLRAYWRRRYGDPPPLRSVRVLRLMLAWRLQAAAWGGLDGSVVRQLRPSGIGGGAKDGLPVGARVSREWRGVVEEVVMTEDGCLWRGQTYAS